jgi:anti-anti-sigma factor
MDPASGHNRPVVAPHFVIEPHPEAPDTFLLRGELDAAAAGTFTHATRGSSRATRVVLRVEHLTFIDSVGIDAVLRLRDSVDASGGRVILQRPARHIVRVLEIVGLADHFEIELT